MRMNMKHNDANYCQHSCKAALMLRSADRPLKWKNEYFMQYCQCD